jgi:hypothetical protein
MSAWRHCVVLLAALVVSGCSGVNNPERFYPAAAELDALKDSDETLIRDYRAAINARSALIAQALRNEIIAQRMYAIDVHYTQYEAALTSERQQIGFASSVVQTGLSTAGALVTPAQTTRILSGLAAAVGATKGFYDSEVIIAKTLQIAQSQMRASRDKIKEQILRKMALNVIDYPLYLAMSDLETLRRAGLHPVSLTPA